MAKCFPVLHKGERCMQVIARRFFSLSLGLPILWGSIWKQWTEAYNFIIWPHAGSHIDASKTSSTSHPRVLYFSPHPVASFHLTHQLYGWDVQLPSHGIWETGVSYAKLSVQRCPPFMMGVRKNFHHLSHREPVMCTGRHNVRISGHLWPDIQLMCMKWGLYYSKCQPLTQ